MRLVTSALAVALGLMASSPPVRAAEIRQYDPMGRLTDIAYPNGGSIHYTYDANSNLLTIVTTTATTAVEGGTPTFEFGMGPVKPNPGSGARSLAFTTPIRAHVSLRVFDASGREVAKLVDRELDGGRHDVQFFTDRWPGGVYFYRLRMGGRTLDGRMVVLR